MLHKRLLTSFPLSKPCPRLVNCCVRPMSSDAPDDVIFEEVADKGIITLNRPKALNALNLSMVKKLYPKLYQWQQEKCLVLVKGAGGKAFCSGGDVKAVVLAGLKGERLGHEFFRQEYTTNGLIGSYKIPYIALIDGIVMGGGVGLSVHGQYRVATEKTLFAMPETQIGFFPDVGGSYFLPKLQGKLGLYLALTGVRLKGSDVYKAGIATHFCQSEAVPALEKELLCCDSRQSIEEVLSKFSPKDLPELSLASCLNQINESFSARCVEEILQRLEKDGSEWALDTIKLLKAMSPTSLKVSFKQLELGSKLSLHECLQMEYRIVVNTLARKEFFEGVRALLIDKDQKPKWQPPTLAEVTADIVDQHFVPLPQDQELKHKL